MGKAFDALYEAMRAGREWSGMDDNAGAKDLLREVFEERCHNTDWGLLQARANLQTKANAASYAGWITADNDTSGGYQGTSFVWMPGEDGSVAVLVIGTQGFGADAALLARPGHRRRLVALSRLHDRRVWVKPDLLDRSSPVPKATTETWPAIDAALKTYSDVIYAAVPVRDDTARGVVEDLVDFFFAEHRVRHVGAYAKRWAKREAELSGALFPRLTRDHVERVLRDRRFVVLEGPPGTGKTRLARQIGEAMPGGMTPIQFHPARTYEDFVVGLAPEPAAGGLAFRVREGDLIRANNKAKEAPHLLFLDEINRADLGKVLGEAVQLFEVGTEARTVELPHPVDGSRDLTLSNHLRVLGTRNTADRSLARMDLAIRRRFAFLTMWPDRAPVEAQGDALALEAFDDCLDTFAQHADDDALPLVPGHAYFLDPNPAAPEGTPTERIRHRLRYELIPLLQEYVDERLVGAATSEVQGLVDRLDARVDAP